MSDELDLSPASPRIDISPVDDPWKLDFADVALEPIHRRNYAVRAFRLSPERILIRGVVDDRADGRRWVPWDTAPLVMHHMIIDLVVAYPSLVVEETRAVMEAHPQVLCPSIAPKYEQLNGVSIARGFTHKVREAFGGPKGCTHLTALLQAMAPVAMQATWPMALEDRRAAAAAAGFDVEHEMLPPLTIEERIVGSSRNLNTCHVFAEDGEIMTNLRAGRPNPVALTVKRRHRQLGIPVDDATNPPAR
jgi:hypothetical protein